MFRIDSHKTNFCQPLCVCVNWYLPFFVPWFYIHNFDIALAWENSRHIATPPLVSQRKDIWGTSAKIPYWWRVIKQIRVVLLMGWSEFPSQHDLSDALPKSGKWQVIAMEFLRSLLRRNFAGKPMIASRNVGCFLRLTLPTIHLVYPRLSPNFCISIVFNFSRADCANFRTMVMQYFLGVRGKHGVFGQFKKGELRD